MKIIKSSKKYFECDECLKPSIIEIENNLCDLTLCLECAIKLKNELISFFVYYPPKEKVEE